MAPTASGLDLKVAMTTQAAGSTSGGDLPDRPPGGWVPPRPAWQQAVVSVFGFVGGRLRTLGGALVLAIGAVLLINAWQTGPARWRESGALRSMTGRGVATLERAWWRLDFDPRPLGQDGTNWEDLSTPELCARIRVERAGTAATSAVYCRQWQKLSRGSLLTHGHRALVSGRDDGARWNPRNRLTRRSKTLTIPPE